MLKKILQLFVKKQQKIIDKKEKMCKCKICSQQMNELRKKILAPDQLPEGLIEKCMRDDKAAITYLKQKIFKER